jgi:hypothetical protein
MGEIMISFIRTSELQRLNDKVNKLITRVEELERESKITVFKELDEWERRRFAYDTSYVWPGASITVKKAVEGLLASNNITLQYVDAIKERPAAIFMNKGSNG